MSADDPTESNGQSTKPAPVFMLYQQRLEYDTEDVERLEGVPELGEEIIVDLVNDSPHDGDVIVREGAENRAPEQLHFDEIGVFFVVLENRQGRSWLIESLDEDEAKAEIEKWFNSDVDRLYFEGTLQEKLQELIIDGSAKLAE